MSLKSESKLSSIRALVLSGSVLTSMMSVFIGCDHIGQANIDKKQNAIHQNTSSASEKGRSDKDLNANRTIVLESERETRLIDIATAQEKIFELESVELFDSSGKKASSMSAEFGAKVLRIVSGSATLDTVEIEGFPLAPCFSAHFLFEDSSRLRLSFLDDHTVWVYAGNSGEYRDVSGDVKKINGLLTAL